MSIRLQVRPAAGSFSCNRLGQSKVFRGFLYIAHACLQLPKRVGARIVFFLLSVYMPAAKRKIEQAPPLASSASVIIQFQSSDGEDKGEIKI